MRRGLFHLEGIGQTAVIVAGVSHTADDRDGDLLNTDLAVEAVDRADQAGRVAGGQLQVVLADALFVVGIAMEEHVRDGVLLAALEDGLDAVFIIVVFFILCADAAGCGVEHDIDLLAQLVKRAGNRDIFCIERGFIRAVDQIEIIFDAVCADHIALAQRLQRKRRGQIRDPDKLHILLQRNAVCQSLTDGAVTGYANSDFFHSNSSR